jgi:tetratricopeptide (TPR) repeat protein
LNYLKGAVAKDPSFAEAYATLAGVQFAMASFNRGSYSEHAPLALEAAQAAVKLDPTVKIAYGVLGGLDRSELRWSSAIVNGEKAVALHPSDSMAWTLLGITQMALGRIDDATTSFEDAERLDPLADLPRLWLMVAAVVSGDEAQATQRAEGIIDLPRSIARYGHFVLALYASDRGDGKAAESHYRECLRPSDQTRPVIGLISKALLSPRSRDDALRGIVSEVASASDFDFRTPLIILRAEDTLLELANKGFKTGYRSAIPVILVHFWSPRFANVRGADRFKDLLRTVGLVDYWKKNGWPDRCRAKGEDDFECS